MLWHPVFRTGTEEVGSEEIDQENLGNAVGSQGIEQLVRVGNREGWSSGSDLLFEMKPRSSND